MPDRADKVDADTLNPLLNPLLSSHMGRWAEVYFTNPPEKRERAVCDLLRELEEGAPSTASVQDVTGASAKENPDTPYSMSSSIPTSEVVHTCGVCAYNNSAGHSFCGMCGAPLQVAPETETPEAAEAAAPILGQSWHERSLEPDSVEETIDAAVNSTAAREPSDAMEAIWRQTERDRAKEKDLPRRIAESEPPSHRYRLYIGAVLAVILAAFAFGVWRGTKARPGVSASSSALAGSNVQPASATSTASPPSTQSASEVQNQNQAVSSSPVGQSADSQIAPQTTPVPPSSSTVTAEQNGAGELAIAEQYLNGTSGMTRDSGEAAQWLWKAVSKRNVEATLALSDLYFRGDGVPKSCDQARLLLDAAARKGAPAAAERLRQLEASNCQ